MARLLRDGYSVHVVDSEIAGSGAIAPSQAWIGGDPRANPEFTFSREDCRKFFNSSTQHFDLVIHLAAVVGGRLTIERNPMAVAEDLSIDSEFWLWAGRTKPKQIVHFSSSAAYPVHLQLPESHRPLLEDDIDFDKAVGIPDLTYGWAKLSSEYLGRFAAKQYELNVLNFRPFSGYGEDQDESYPFPAIIRRALKASSAKTHTFEVWGSGFQERDFIHISDIVELVMRASSMSIHGFSTYNLGNGIPVNFIDLAKISLSKVGLDIPVVGKSAMPEGVFSRVANTNKMRDALGLPSISLDQGIARALAFLS